MSQMKTLEALKKLYLKSNGYLFGELTVIDFIFYEGCFDFEGFLKHKMTGDKIVYKMYKKFFESTPFYLKNQDNLEQYKYLIPDVPEFVNRLLSKIWIGDTKYLNSQY